MASSTTTASSIAPNITTLINDTTSKVSDNPDEWMTTSAPRIAFLAFFLLFGFVGNLFLIITICHSQRFRVITFYVFIVNLAVVNLCECVLNMSILLAASILNEWTIGKVSCSLSVSFLSFISIETVLGLTVLTVDRLVAVRYRDKYDIVVSTPRITIVLVFTWFQSFSFSIPIAVGAVPTSVNNYTKCCTLAKNSSIYYGVFTAAFCFVVPLILMIIIFVKIIRTGYKERVMVRTLISQHSYKDEGAHEPRIKQEIRHSSLTGTACATWLIIQGPYIVTYYFNELKNSSELEKTTSNSNVQYVWYVDLVLLWLRFSYVIVLPIASFTWNKELWKSFKDMVLCRKNNSVEDESFKKSEADSLKLEKKIRDEEKAKEKIKETVTQTPREQRVFQVPVLFATSHGVHIQTASQTNVFEVEGEQGRTKPLRGKKCDVEGSRENLNFEDDTSDYDSANEMDPFSVSNPVSVRQLESEGLTDRQRSVSNPEVRENAKSESKADNETVGSTSAGDSGLDLSSGTPLHRISIGNATSAPLEGNEVHESKKEFVAKPKTNAFEIIEESVSANESDRTTEKERTTVARDGDRTEHSKVHGAGTDNEDKDKGTEAIISVKKKKTSINGAIDSPAQRRKKKKRKEKNLDNISNASDLSCTTLPLRPPPRLAPIMPSGGAKSFQTGRPGSSCSSQFSYTDMGIDASAVNQEKCLECGKYDSGSCDNLSVASFSLCRNLSNTRTALKQAGAFDNQETDSQNEKRKIRSVPEETLNGCENESFDKEKWDDCDESATNDVTRTGSLGAGDSTSQARVRNTEARRKRRERLSTNSLLNDGKGYQRLIPETP